MGRNQTLAGEPRPVGPGAPGQVSGGQGRTADPSLGSWGNSRRCCRSGAAVSHPGSTCPRLLAWKGWGGETEQMWGGGGVLLDRGGPRPRPALFTEGPES